MKSCKGCSTLFPIERFSRHPTTKDKLQPRCKKCSSDFMKKYTEENKFILREKKKAYYKLHPEIAKKSQYGRYGITINEYNRIFQIQGGMCAICKNHQGNLKRSLAIDHCHSTKKIRGLLCQKCNQGLGNFRDNIDFLNEAISYLKNGK